MRAKKRKASAPRERKVRYAVVGLGHIAQAAVLPAFANARKNSRLVALVSDDPVKHRQLSRQYDVERIFPYNEYEACLRSGEIDAVYIALPNSMHRDFAVHAARAGIHVLCEKPLALNEKECTAIIRACADYRVKLMTAYRLHFERPNLEAIKIVRSGKLGRPRFFNSLFSFQVRPDNIRVREELGGGTLYDIGIYCINAARYLFGAEPVEVFAYSTGKTDPRFKGVDEMTSAVLRFADGRLASFTSSFGAAARDSYEIVGTKGVLRATDVYGFIDPVRMEITVGGETEQRTYSRRDQFGPELVYFSDCILRNKDPEPDGVEGLIDVHIIRALYESARTGEPVKLKDLTRRRRPTLRQEIKRPPVKEPRLVHVQAPER